MHSPTKILLGSTEVSDRVISSHLGSIAAGLAVVQKSDGSITSVLADGALLGVSAGKDLSNAGYTAVIRKGSKVPILIDAFSPVKGAQVQIHATSGIAVASGTAVNATFVEARTGVKEDGTEANAWLIDMVGGL